MEFQYQYQETVNWLRQQLAAEKKRRMHYQHIVYNVCNMLDQIDGRHPGNGIVCGTAEEPHSDIETRIQQLTAERDSLRKQLAAANANVSDLRGKLDYMTAYRDGLHQRLVTEQQQLAAEREANRWIPVSERLPTVSGNYLTNASHWITAHELVFTVKTKQWWDSTNQEYVEPTHWRELPKFYQEISS